VSSWWAILLVIPAVTIALFDWRKGLFAMLVVAFLQDAARKLEVDQPVYFTLLSGMVLAATYVRAQVPRPFWPTQIGGWNHYLRRPSIAFVLILVVQAGLSIVRYGNPTIAAIGALSYLAPLPAMLLAYHFALRSGRSGIQRWLSTYLICTLVTVPTVVLEYAGAGWVTLGQVGAGFEMYEEYATLTAHSGFFRGSETAAWHTATAVCYLLLLSSLRRLSQKQIILAVTLIVALLSIGVLTGRRKIFVEIVIFMSVYVSLLLVFRKGGFKLAVAVFVGGVISYAVLTWWIVERPIDVAAADAPAYQYYAQRSASVSSGVSERFLGMGFGPVEWAIDRFGWLGGGLGIASQGAQHFGGGAEVYGGAGEGGLGKIAAELGIPGLLVALWFAFSAVRYAWAVLVHVSARSAATARLAYGLAGFLVANLAVFFVATQAFGDVFVLTMLGMLAGFFTATPVLAEREKVRSAAARGARPARPPTGVPAMRNRV
jgi:hypothetical protein